MRTLRQRRWASTALALSATLMISGNSRLHAQDKLAQRPSSSATRLRTRYYAFARGRHRGDPHLVGTALLRKVVGGLLRRSLGADQPRPCPGRERVQGCRARASQDDGRDTVPHRGHFRPGDRGVTQLGTIGDCDTPEALVDRLRTLDLGLSTAAKADPAVTPSSLGGDIYASQQYTTPTAPATPSQVPQTPAFTPQAPQMAMVPTFVPQAVPTTASVIQVPSQSLMIQQAPPQIIMGPARTVVYAADDGFPGGTRPPRLPRRPRTCSCRPWLRLPPRWPPFPFPR